MGLVTELYLSHHITVVCYYLIPHAACHRGIFNSPAQVVFSLVIPYCTLLVLLNSCANTNSLAGSAELQLLLKHV